MLQASQALSNTDYQVIHAHEKHLIKADAITQQEELQ